VVGRVKAVRVAAMVPSEHNCTHTRVRVRVHVHVRAWACASMGAHLSACKYSQALKTVRLVMDAYPAHHGRRYMNTCGRSCMPTHSTQGST